MAELIQRLNNIDNTFTRLWCSIFHRNYHAFDQVYDPTWGARVERRLCSRCRAKKMGS